MVRELVKDPEKQADYLFKLIESLDHSETWTYVNSKKKMGEIYDSLHMNIFMDIK